MGLTPTSTGFTILQNGYYSYDYRVNATDAVPLILELEINGVVGSVPGSRYYAAPASGFGIAFFHTGDRITLNYHGITLITLQPLIFIGLTGVNASLRLLQLDTAI